MEGKRHKSNEKGKERKRQKDTKTDKATRKR
jgi:hypothetical protein